MEGLASESVIDEFVNCAGKGKKLVFEHIAWLGWELVTVCKGYMYYKRQTTERDYKSLSFWLNSETK